MPSGQPARRRRYVFCRTAFTISLTGRRKYSGAPSLVISGESKFYRSRVSRSPAGRCRRRLPRTQPPDIHAIAQAVDNHYNHLRTLQAEFSESYRGAGIERSESGSLWLKKPGKMRWEYRSPKEKLFLSDGKEAWFYIPGDRQVRRTSVKKLDDLRSPLALLLGKTRLEKELDGLSAGPGRASADPG